MLKQKDISNRKPEGGYEAITTILPLIMMTHGRETMAHGATMSQKDSEVMSWPREPRTGPLVQQSSLRISKRIKQLFLVSRKDGSMILTDFTGRSKGIPEPKRPQFISSQEKH